MYTYIIIYNIWIMPFDYETKIQSFVCVVEFIIVHVACTHRASILSIVFVCFFWQFINLLIMFAACFILHAHQRYLVSSRSPNRNSNKSKVDPQFSLGILINYEVCYDPPFIFSHLPYYVSSNDIIIDSRQVIFGTLQHISTSFFLLILSGDPEIIRREMYQDL